MENYQYIKQIVDAVDKTGKFQSIIREEMIDHFCSYYESLIQYYDAEIAMSKTIFAIQETSTFSNNNQTMSNMKLALVSLCFIPIIAFFFTNDSGTIESESVGIVTEVIEEKMEPPYGLPIESAKLTSTFGKRMHPILKVLKFHKGVDFKAALGTPVKTVEKGVVVEAGYNKRLGNYIVIQHDEIYSTRYHHLDKIDVNKDQKLNSGDKIGEVGTTGASTGPHLHYEVLKEGENVDPEKYIRA